MAQQQWPGAWPRTYDMTPAMRARLVNSLHIKPGVTHDSSGVPIGNAGPKSAALARLMMASGPHEPMSDPNVVERKLVALSDDFSAANVECVARLLRRSSRCRRCCFFADLTPSRTHRRRQTQEILERRRRRVDYLCKQSKEVDLQGPLPALEHPAADAPLAGSVATSHVMHRDTPAAALLDASRTSAGEGHARPRRALPRAELKRMEALCVELRLLLAACCLLLLLPAAAAACCYPLCSCYCFARCRH